MLLPSPVAALRWELVDFSSGRCQSVMWWGGTCTGAEVFLGFLVIVIKWMARVFDAIPSRFCPCRIQRRRSRRNPSLFQLQRNTAGLRKAVGGSWDCGRIVTSSYGKRSSWSLRMRYGHSSGLPVRGRIRPLVTHSCGFQSFLQPVPFKRASPVIYRKSKCCKKERAAAF